MRVLYVGLAIVAIALLALTLRPAPQATAASEFGKFQMNGAPNAALPAIDPYVSPDNIGLF